MKELRDAKQCMSIDVFSTKSASIYVLFTTMFGDLDQSDLQRLLKVFGTCSFMVGCHLRVRSCGSTLQEQAAVRTSRFDGATYYFYLIVSQDSYCFKIKKLTDPFVRSLHKLLSLRWYTFDD